MRTEPYIDRVFRGYGEAEFGKEVMDGLTSAQVEEARCAAMQMLAEATKEQGIMPKGTAKIFFCMYVKHAFLLN